MTVKIHDKYIAVEVTKAQREEITRRTIPHMRCNWAEALETYPDHIMAHNVVFYVDESDAVLPMRDDEPLQWRYTQSKVGDPKE